MRITSGLPRLLRAGTAAALLSVLLICAAAPLGAQSAPGAQLYDVAGLNITPGSSSTELNFAWTAPSNGKAVVQVAPKKSQKGDSFPASAARSFPGTASRISATLFTTTDQTVVLDSWACKAVVKGLADSTEYVYRVGDGRRWSAVSTFSTRDPAHFSFFVVADPQLGSKATGPKTLASDTAGWQDTISKATATFPDASFMISLGDQVNDYNQLPTQEAEYQAYFSPAQLRSLPVATVNGNHDFQMGEYYGFHYNQPNLSPRYGISYGNDGDYWFVYGNVLFIMLNSNTENVAPHDLFIRDAVAKNPNAAWRVVSFHHSIYSEADHPADPDVLDRRAAYPPVFERFGIDVVLQGHDHSYTRTFPMAKGKPVQADPAANTITDPAGILYFTFDSASGSKFYDWKNPAPEAYSAARWQGKVPSFSRVSVDGNRFTVMTFRTDDMSLIDACTIVKNR